MLCTPINKPNAFSAHLSVCWYRSAPNIYYTHNIIDHSQILKLSIFRHKTFIVKEFKERSIHSVGWNGYCWTISLLLMRLWVPKYLVGYSYTRWVHVHADANSSQAVRELAWITLLLRSTSKEINSGDVTCHDAPSILREPIVAWLWISMQAKATENLQPTNIGFPTHSFADLMSEIKCE